MCDEGKELSPDKYFYNGISKPTETKSASEVLTKASSVYTFKTLLGIDEIRNRKVTRCKSLYKSSQERSTSERMNT